MKYSIVMPCFNEAHVLNFSLSSIRAAIGDRDDTEIILMDNGSSDGSQQLAKSFGANIHQIENVKISALRNQGAKLSRGRFIIFLDADIQVPPDWLDHLDQYADPENKSYQADVVGFVDNVPSSSPWFARIWGLRASAKRPTLMPIDSLPGRNIFLKKEWFDKVNGFNESLITGEDKDFVMRLKKAGATVLSDPRLDMIHLGFERTFKEWCKKEYWRQHSHISLIQNQGMSLRLLRFPLLAVIHLILLSLTMALTLTNFAGAALFMLCFSVLPGLLISLKSKTSRSSFTLLVQFTLLYWLRFQIAGWSVLMELKELNSNKA